MSTVTLSPNFEVVIPRDIRDALKLAPGGKLLVQRQGDHVELIPVREASEMRGFLRGMEVSLVREDDRI